MKRTHQPQPIAHRWKVLAVGLLLPLSLTTGCSTMSHTGEGIAGGAIVGGVLGTFVGCLTGRPLAGAAIGAGLGGTVGGVSGAAEDRRDRRDSQAVAAAVQRGQDELVQVVNMKQGGVSDALIIQHVRQSGAVFNLSGEQIIWLKQNGVSEVVISEIQARSGLVRVRPAYPGYVVQPAPVVVYEQVPPPVPTVGVGVTYTRR